MIGVQNANNRYQAAGYLSQAPINKD